MENVTLEASAIQFTFADVGDNPNRMPYKGVLTYFDVPSDKPPGGSGGRKVLIPSSVGIPALDSLKGMGVNLAADADDHEVTHKIGIITDAYTGQLTAKGLEVIVEGHIFARDFPREAAMVKLNQSNLGFSYETANTLLASQEINGEDVAVTQSLVFTGAAILLKKAAAYQNTSIAASSKSKEDVINVNEEQMKALLEGFKTDILASVDGKLDELKAAAKPVEPVAPAVTVSEPTPAAVTASATPEAPVDVAAIVKAAVAEAMKDVKPVTVTASSTEPQQPTPPARKSFTPGSLLAKYDVKSENGDLMAAIDSLAEKAGLDVSQRMAMKLQAWAEQAK